jgi:hypothetical protein
VDGRGVVGGSIKNWAAFFPVERYLSKLKTRKSRFRRIRTITNDC